MSEIKHPETIQELIENYLPNYKEQFAEFNKVHSSKFELEDISRTFNILTFGHAIRCYRLACEKSAWERVCKNMRDKCTKERISKKINQYENN